MDFEEETVGKLISHIYRQNQKGLGRDLQPYGHGSGGQYGFLKLVLTKPGITQEKMTGEMKFDKATTARTVKLLESQGYIDRRPDPHDRRSAFLYPTEKAIHFAPVLHSILRGYNEKLITGLTEEEREQLIRMLLKVNENAAALVAGGSKASPEPGSDATIAIFERNKRSGE